MRQRLAARGIRFPEALAVTVQVTADPAPEFGERRYALAFRKPAAAPPPVVSGGSGEGSEGGAGGDRGRASAAAGERPAAAASSPHRAAAGSRPLLRLTVIKGQAAQPSYDLAAERIFLGRLEEVLDAAGRVLRRNDVAFLEEGELSHTVSREHARIAWDAASQSYWLRDEGSAAGTVIFRAGRSIEVSRHDRRGVRLETGDEVYLGRAALKMEIAPRPAAARPENVAAAKAEQAAPKAEQVAANAEESVLDAQRAEPAMEPTGQEAEPVVSKAEPAVPKAEPAVPKAEPVVSEGEPAVPESGPAVPESGQAVAKAVQLVTNAEQAAKPPAHQGAPEAEAAVEGE